MAKKSRQRKFDAKRPPESGKSASLAAATHKPWQIAAVCLLLAVVTILAYQGVRHNDFLIYDDDVYVVDNQHVHQGLTAQSIDWAFTTYYASNWHPLTWISHMADWQLYGKNPAGHHMTNVCLHAADAILLFLFLLYITGYLGRSAIVAFLFALHPAHVESVAWLAERKDVLCAFFWFATFLAYAWHLRKPSWKRYASIILLYACALMAKPMAVTLPFTLLLLDYWPLRRIAFTPETRSTWFSSFFKLCIEKWPLFIMAAISSILTFFAQHSGGSVGSLESLPLWERLSNASISYWRYVKIMFWPDPLRAFYFHQTVNVSVIAAICSVIGLILVTIVCWRIRQKRPYCLIGWLWFLGTLVPVIGIMQVGDQAMAERYTYIPFIGLFIAVVWLVGDTVANSPAFKITAQLLAVAVIAACAVKTYAQVKIWKNTISVFSHVIEVDPRGEIPNASLGVAYERLDKPAQALAYFERALVYSPNWSLPLSYSALCMMQLEMQTNNPRNMPLAGQRLQQALSVAPDDPDVLSNLALWSALMGKSKDEETYSRRAIAAHPEDVKSYLYLANALESQNDLNGAAQQYRKALDMDPTNYISYNTLGMILSKQGLHQEALKEFRLSLNIKPDQAMAHTNIGRVLLETHQFPEASDEFAQALRFEPESADTHNNLGVAYYQSGNYEKALGQFSDAVRINPAFADARRNLESLQARMKTGNPGPAGK
jgi:protein O-mannosyl-transferase